MRAEKTLSPVSRVASIPFFRGHDPEVRGEFLRASPAVRRNSFYDNTVLSPIVVDRMAPKSAMRAVPRAPVNYVSGNTGVPAFPVALMVPLRPNKFRNLLKNWTEKRGPLPCERLPYQMESFKPVARVPLQSTDDASWLTALLVRRIYPLFSLLAPCQPGAAPVSVRGGTLATG